MKVSEITIECLKNYMRIEYNEEDPLIQNILTGSKVYIKNYTGLTVDQIDEKEDLTLAAYVLCSEMYENRQYTVDKIKINPIIQSILDMHSVNLL